MLPRGQRAVPSAPVHPIPPHLFPPSSLLTPHSSLLTPHIALVNYRPLFSLKHLCSPRAPS
eukprot:764569-Hanusia_phi.AAC.4